ncbi:DHS-like NAD/FAD-binding domain-containing protein [Mycotypha africana]|uniref:DHS-like NAD/FAD-binding domain-containing protein n=1 Tax=Mycotypha africana TaxID=64632 RepID=UPI00230174E1|nr:DHS-like NAD/FAD-binding domain-containing protein [Mycotypha africana]KAI8988052.1 DHS-like NAD/FAD-binding domain-containing protein [Mycotypha africana]
MVETAFNAEGTIETEEITNPTVGDDNSTVTTTKTANSDKLTLEDMFNEDEYNEESDQDWASGDEGSESDSHDSVEEELLEHRAFQIPQPLNTTATIGADADNDVDVDGNDDDEAMYKLPWEPFTDQEMENIREEAKEKGLMKFIEKYVVQNETPVPKLLEAFNIFMHPQAAILASDKELLPILKSIVTRYLRKRSRLQTVNTLEDVANLLSKANNIMIVTGAGVSVSCGIPDFRSETGIYSRLQEYELDDPQQMFDIDYFRVAPEIFYSFAKELYPSNYEPSPSHHFVKLIEEKGKLLRNYTQNIDTLEHKANIKRVVNCHGSFATASCVTCGYKVDGKEIEEYIMKQQIPPCPRCAEAAEKSNISNNTSHKNKGNDSSEDDDDKEHSYRKRGVSIMKPDITFFGEQLPAEFDNLLAIDTEKVDLLIVMGSSLKVSPVSEIMSQMPHSVPQILVNRTPITHMTFDIQLLGDSDVIVPELCRMLKWDLKHPKLPGGSALSTESYKLSREGDGDEVEVTDSFNEKHKERKIWKYIKDGLYTFPGAVLDPKYISKERYDERGSLGSEDDNSIDNSIDEEEATANEVLGVANSDNVNDRNGE